MAVNMREKYESLSLLYCAIREKSWNQKYSTMRKEAVIEAMLAKTKSRCCRTHENPGDGDRKNQ